MHGLTDSPLAVALFMQLPQTGRTPSHRIFLFLHSRQACNGVGDQAGSVSAGLDKN